MSELTNDFSTIFSSSSFSSFPKMFGFFSGYENNCKIRMYRPKKRLEFGVILKQNAIGRGINRRITHFKWWRVVISVIRACSQDQAPIIQVIVVFAPHFDIQIVLNLNSMTNIFFIHLNIIGDNFNCQMLNHMLKSNHNGFCSFHLSHSFILFSRNDIHNYNIYIQTHWSGAEA